MNISPYCRNVYYYETDRMNVVSHTNYIRWMEEARIDFLKQIGIPYHKIEETGYMLPVIEVKCRYNKSLTYGDDFSVYSVISEYNGFKMKISYEIYNSKTKELCASAESCHCFTDSDMRPVRISKKSPSLHEAFLNAMSISYKN